MSNWWGSRKNVSARLVWEVEAMKATFGNTFKLVVPPFGGLLYWQGMVEINMSILDSPGHRLSWSIPRSILIVPLKPIASSRASTARNINTKMASSACSILKMASSMVGTHPSRLQSPLAAGRSSGYTPITPGAPPGTGPELRNALRRARHCPGGGGAHDAAGARAGILKLAHVEFEQIRKRLRGWR